MTNSEEIIFPSEDQLEVLTKDHPKPEPPRTFLSIIREQFKAHPLTTLWSLILFIGGVIFIAYYFYIRYMPELDLAASASLLAAVSLTGIFVTFIFAVYAVCSGAVWGEAIKENPSIKALLFKWGRVDTGRLLLLVIVPAALFTIIVNLLLWSPAYPSFNYLALAAGIVLVLLLLFNIRRYINSNPQLPRRASAIYIFVTFISWGFLLFQLFLILLIANPRLTPLSPTFFRLLALQVMVVFLNPLALIMPKSFKSSFLGYVAAGFIIVAVTLIGLGALMLVPNGVIKQFGFGNITNASIVVNEEGRELLRRRDVPSVCAKEESATCLEEAEGAKMFTAKNVDILSRLGSSYYLRCKYRDGKSIEFTLPSSMVLSWGRAPR